MSLQDEEPQAVAPVAPVPEVEGAETDVDGIDSDLAPETPEGEKVTFNEGQQKVFNEAIDRKTRKLREAERESERLQVQLTDAKSKIPQETRPGIPDSPDPYGDDYDAKVQARDKAIADAASFDVRQTEQTRQNEQEQQRQQDHELQQVNKVVADYAGRAEGLGVSSEQLAVAAEIVNGHGISNQVTAHILTDDKGPAITKYLADNPAVLSDLSGLQPMQAAIFIDQKVKPFIEGKKTTDTPDPATTLAGGGSPPGERGPQGAKFE